MAARKVFGVVKGRKGCGKQTRWWNDEVKSAQRRKKVMYRRLLDLGTEEAKKYNEAKTEAKRVVRRAKSEECVQLGRELEKDVSGNPQRFWARINGRRSKDSMSCIHDENGRCW